jgi:hypothetical protein
LTIRPATGFGATRRDRGLPLLLYAGSFLVFSLALTGLPDYLYNWEEYTVWKWLPGLADPGQALAASFRLNDGLMTNSGETPAMLGPLLLLGSWLGPDLFSLRLFPVAFASLAAPLLYGIGREVYGRQVALLAAGMLMTSGCYALYARTATNVGISLVPGLLTLWLWLRWQRQPKPEVALALGALFLVEAYFYATIRLLVLLAVPLVGYTLWRKRPPSALTQAALIFLPLLIFLTWQRPTAPPVVGSVLAYFNGRGEQIVAMYEQAGDAGIVADVPANLQGWLPSGLSPRITSTIALVAGNVQRYVNLFVSYDTAPALTDFWNAKGRLYQPFLVPFFLLGLLAAVRQWRRAENAILLLFLGGVSLPIVLTNNVHVGRLLLALPPVFLLAAQGWNVTLATLGSGWRRPAGYRSAWFAALGTLLVAVWWGVLRPGSWWPAAPAFVLLLALALVLLPSLLRRRQAVVAAALATIAILAVGAWQEYAVPTAPHYVHELAEGLRSLPGPGPVVLVSRRNETMFGEMEANSLAFYLRGTYSVRVGTPAGWQTNSPPRALYDVVGYAQKPEVLPSSLPAGTTLAVDREVGQEAVVRLTRQFGERIVLLP